MKNLKRIGLIAIIYLIILGAFSSVKAASATISSNKTKMNVGDTATITVSVNAASWNIHVTGDVSINEADGSSDGENTKKTFTATLKPTKAGTYEVKLSGDVSDGSTMQTQNVSGSVKIEVTEKATPTPTKAPTATATPKPTNTPTPTPTVSSDATLKNLGITPKQYDFSGFKKNNTSYSLTVPYAAEKINIYATPSSTKSTVTGTGSKTLKVGRNEFSVKVTAEDKKTTKIYNLVITRKEEGEEPTPTVTPTATPTPTEETGAKMALGLYKLSLKGKTDNGEEVEIELNKEFDRKTLEYICDVPSNVTKVSIQTEAYDYNDSVKITGADQELKQGENLITISVNDEKETISYKITLNKNSEKVAAEETTTENTETNSKLEEAKAKFKTSKKGILIGGIVGIFALGILITFIVIKIQDKRAEKYEDSDIEDDDE